MIVRRISSAAEKVSPEWKALGRNCYFCAGENMQGGTMAGKIYRDPEIGDIELVKTRLGRRVSIKVHPVRGVVVTVPFFMRYQDGLDFFMRKREWVAGALRRQQEKTDAAERSGTAVGTLRDGVTCGWTVCPECGSCRCRGAAPEAGRCVRQDHDGIFRSHGGCKPDRAALPEPVHAGIPQAGLLSGYHAP